ncbi:hypothetical protein GW17_00010726 [Ensete ventricosum]|nr:hypothetical protein GW17_00010726 [Ensete ventricosum]RZR82864.1 hypothetical protein BHM03_00009392 [Ensete ventricosum]
MRSIQLQTREGFQEPRPPAERDRKPHQEWTAKLRKRKTRGGWPFAAESAPGSKSNNEKRDTKPRPHSPCVRHVHLALVLCDARAINLIYLLRLIKKRKALKLQEREKEAKRRRRTTALPCVGSTNGEGHASDAEGPGIAEHGDETTAEVEAHESLEAPHGNAADEESWKPAVPGRGCGSLFVGLLQLDGRWVGAHHRQQPLHDVAHAALPPVEDDRGVLPDQPRHPLLRRLIRPVDGQHCRPPLLPPRHRCRRHRSHQIASLPPPPFGFLFSSRRSMNRSMQKTQTSHLYKANNARRGYRRLTRGKSVAPTADKALVYGRDVTLLARRRSLDGRRRLRSIGSRRREASNASIIDS